MSIFPGQSVSLLTHPRKTQCEDQTLTTRGTPRTMNKTELKFSIENILGLSNSDRSTTELCNEGFKDNDISDHCNYDDDNDNEDGEDDESIDVDDSQTDERLSAAGDKTQASGCEESLQFPWIQCTRYHPPKLQSRFLRCFLFLLFNYS
jgi:hypothetical protein